MYGLPKDIDLDFFHKKTLTCISFGPACFIMTFTGNPGDTVSLNVQSEVSCILLGKPEKRPGEIGYNLVAPALLELMSKDISSATGAEDGTLTLEFEQGDQLIIFDDSRQFESYQIQHDEHLIVV